MIQVYEPTCHLHGRPRTISRLLSLDCLISGHWGHFQSEPKDERSSPLYVSTIYIYLQTNKANKQNSQWLIDLTKIYINKYCATFKEWMLITEMVKKNVCSLVLPSRISQSTSMMCTSCSSQTGLFLQGACMFLWLEVCWWYSLYLESPLTTFYWQNPIHPLKFSRQASTYTYPSWSCQLNVIFISLELSKHIVCTFLMALSSFCLMF